MIASEIPNPEFAETSSAAVRREGSSGAARATRLEKAERERRVVSLLNRGVSVPEIAEREGLTLKRTRNLVREILARRLPQPPAEFLALQVSRLNEALLVAYSAMHTATAGANFEAVDRVVENRPRTRPLSRICGCPATARGARGAPAPAARRASARARRPKPE